MSRNLIGLGGLAVVSAVGAALTGISQGDANPKTASIERGKYLVTIMGCADCHSPHDKPVRSRLGRRTADIQ